MFHRSGQTRVSDDLIGDAARFPETTQESSVDGCWIVSNRVLSGKEHPGIPRCHRDALGIGRNDWRRQEIVVATRTSDGHETVRTPRPRICPPTSDDRLLRLRNTRLPEDTPQDCYTSKSKIFLLSKVLNLMVYSLKVAASLGDH